MVSHLKIGYNTREHFFSIVNKKEREHMDTKIKQVVCFGLLPSTGQLIKIVRGESGYYPYVDTNTNLPVTGKDAAKKMKEGNAELGLTDEQVRAMFDGSMFGWDCKAAKAAWTI